MLSTYKYADWLITPIDPLPKGSASAAGSGSQGRFLLTLAGIILLSNNPVPDPTGTTNVIQGRADRFLIFPANLGKVLSDAAREYVPAWPSGAPIAFQLKQWAIAAGYLASEDVSREMQLLSAADRSGKTTQSLFGGVLMTWDPPLTGNTQIHYAIQMLGWLHELVSPLEPPGLTPSG